MRKYISILLVFLLAVAQASASFDVGLDFRATSGFVTDPAYGVFVTDTDSYPHSYSNSNGINFTGGFTQGAISSRDRSAAVDARLAGINFVGNNTATLAIFRIDLPATGSYNIGLAAGDNAASQTNITVSFADNGTVFANAVTNASTGSNVFYDATGASLSGASWPGSNATISHTFTSTTFTVIFGCNCGQSTNSTIAHVRITSAGGGGPTQPPTLASQGVGH